VPPPGGAVVCDDAVPSNPHSSKEELKMRQLRFREAPIVPELFAPQHSFVLKDRVSDDASSHFPSHDGEAAHLTFPRIELVINGPILRQTRSRRSLPARLLQMPVARGEMPVARGNAGPKLLAQNKWTGMAWRCPTRIGLGKAVRS